MTCLSLRVRCSEVPSGRGELGPGYCNGDSGLGRGGAGGRAYSGLWRKKTNASAIRDGDQ
jgi:hypothetical protein